MKSYAKLNLPEPLNDAKYLSKSVYDLVFNNERNLQEPLLFNNVLPVESCKDLISYYEKQNHKDRSYQGIVDKKLRDCTYVLTDNIYDDILTKYLKNIVVKLVPFKIKEEFTFKPIIYRYTKGTGFTWHHDMVTAVEVKNSSLSGQAIIGGDYTIVWFLNSMSEEQGGNLIFYDFPNLIIKPKQGSVAIFRVDLVHAVEPIKFGARYSIVSRIFAL